MNRLISNYKLKSKKMSLRIALVTKLKEMKRTKLFLTLAIAFIFSASCISQEDYNTQIRDVKDFTGIDVSEGIKVIVTMGDKEKVEVTADEDYINKVITENNNGTLDIYIKGNNGWKKGRKIVVKVDAIKINKLKASSGASLKTTNIVKTEDLRISASSGAHASANCETENVSTSSSSGAHVNIEGSTIHLTAKASSGASVEAQDLKAQKVNADVSSGANIKVHAEKALNADASSGGSVRYSGSPEMKDFDKSSGGSVRGL